mgnify:CR=1 FL=1
MKTIQPLGDRALLENYRLSLGRPVSEETRAEILKHVQDLDRRFAEAAEKHPVPDQMDPGLVFRQVWLGLQHAPAAHQDQLGAWAGDGYVQPLGLEEELSQLLGEPGAGGGQRDQHDLALLALHALDGVDHQFAQGFLVLDDPARQAADQAALGAVRHHYSDLLRRHAAQQQRIDQLHHGLGFDAAAHRRQQPAEADAAADQDRLNGGDLLGNGELGAHHLGRASLVRYVGRMPS